MRLSLQIALLLAALVLVFSRIPARAFAFQARPAPQFEPGAEFLELDAATFTLLRRRVLASSLSSSSRREGATDREIGAFALEEPLLAVPPLDEDESRRCALPEFGSLFKFPRALIKPASFAAGELKRLSVPKSEGGAPGPQVFDLDDFQFLNQP